MKTSQAFQFYPADFLLGTALMTPAQCGIYIRLLCYQWQEGSLPNDENLLARLASCEPQEIGGVLSKFRVEKDGTLKNAKLESVRKSLNAWRLSRVENGKKGGRPKKLVVSGSFPKTKAKKSSPSPSPSPIPLFNHEPVVMNQKHDPDSKPNTKQNWREQAQEEARRANALNVTLDLQAHPDIVHLWREWCGHRTELAMKEKRKPWTERAARNEMLNLSHAVEDHGSEPVAMQMRTALASGWQGLNLNTMRPAYGQGSQQRKTAHEQPSGI